MNWGKIMIGAVVAEIILILGFNYQLDSPNETFHFGHYVWLIMIAVIFLWAWKKKRRENRRYGWLKRRIIKMTNNQLAMMLGGLIFCIPPIILFLSLKFFAEPIWKLDIIVMVAMLIIGLGFAGGGFFFEEAGRFISGWQGKFQRMQKSLAKTRLRFHKKTLDGVNHAT